jgi:hypothetical protein
LHRPRLPRLVPKRPATPLGTLIELRDAMAAFPAMNALAPSTRGSAAVPADGTVAWTYPRLGPTIGFRPGWRPVA